jgi:hypothetical protein
MLDLSGRRSKNSLDTLVRKNSNSLRMYFGLMVSVALLLAIDSLLKSIGRCLKQLLI